MTPEVEKTCPDCGVQPWDFLDEDGLEVQEDFYVGNDLFDSVFPDGGIPCIGCFEARLGRKLVPGDFRVSPYSDGTPNEHGQWATLFLLTNRHPSARYRDRIGWEGPLPTEEMRQQWLLRGIGRQP